MKRNLQWLFWILTAALAGMVWLYRSFPTQDGPMQIYLANVLGDLIRGTGNYSSYYQPQGYAHPYSFWIYALTLLNAIFHPLTSEKILISAYFLGFALGARFLVRSIRPDNDWLPLFMLPFAFNTYLCLGIYNFSFAIALLMFMIGAWLRWSGQWTAARSLIWLALLMLMALMHHVCLLILGVFTGVHWIARAVQLRGPGDGWRSLRRDAANVVLLAVPLGWYGVFAVASVRSVPPTISAVSVTWIDRIRALMEMLPISPYLASGYCFWMLTLVMGPVALLMLRPSGVKLAWKPAATACVALLTTAGVSLLVYVFGPHFLFGHGHGYFAERMALPFVILALASLAPLELPIRLRNVVAAFATVVFLYMSVVRDRETTRMVANLAPVYDAQPIQRGSWGAIISGREGLDGYTFNPYFWAGALYAQQGKSVLLNLSWSYEPISLFATKDAHPWNDTTSHDHFRQVLLRSSEPVSPPVQFLCGGKWDASAKDAVLLAQRNGLTPLLDSEIYYCYGSSADRELARR